jgi:predicted transcriptional regulator
MIQSLLKKLDFTDKEIEIYLGILKNGKITPADLASYTRINRSTVYSVAKELIKKGVVSEDLSGTSSYLVALPPEDLENLIKKQEKEIKEKKKIIDQTVKELKKVTSEVRYSIPKVRFIPEEDLENFLYKQTPIWNESVKKEKTEWLGFQDETFVVHYEPWIDWYWNNASKGINLKLFSTPSDIEAGMTQKKYPGREIKILKSKNPFTATTWINGAYIIMMVTDKRPHYAIEIYNHVLAENFREVFKIMWKQN